MQCLNNNLFIYSSYPSLCFADVIFLGFSFFYQKNNIQNLEWYGYLLSFENNRITFKFLPSSNIFFHSFCILSEVSLVWCVTPNVNWTYIFIKWMKEKKNEWTQKQQQRNQTIIIIVLRRPYITKFVCITYFQLFYLWYWSSSQYSD